MTIHRTSTALATAALLLVSITPLESIPEDIHTLVNVVGLNFLGHFDFQIDFSEPDTPETLTFFSR